MPAPFDDLLPAEMAEKAEQVGIAKASRDALTTFTLAVLAGAFIALGAVFATTVGAGAESLPYGVGRLLVGLAFSLGLVLVIVGGAELFTGNNLIVMAWAARKVSLSRLLANWAIVLAGNAVGAIGTALLVVLADHHHLGGGAVGATALATAAAKCDLPPLTAFARGVLCNTLVCLAVWLSFSARTTAGKVMVVVPPVVAFVAAGFEHSIANLYFVPVAQLLSVLDPGFVASGATAGVEVPTLGELVVHNLLPVTAGNIVGGAGLVGLVYWFVYLRGRA